MATAEKLDLYKDNKKEYAATPKPALVEIGPAVYLSISGRGAPGGSAFTDAIGALYGVAFTVKMTRKFAGKRDYAVSKLEAVWPNLNSNDPTPDKEQWTWQLMIRTPKFVTEKDLSQARETLAKRGKGAGVERVELRPLSEGLCVQALHVGPYDDEGKTMATMRAFAEKQGLRVAGAHHEIYLSDPRRVEASKLKTILREPVRKVEA
ncbi:MAG TPA: GyrI-like domain-containing protein [Terriglobales bacterium]|nr:GyrI-like domain-containing protein [Terriglobales bacterium]